MGFAGRGCPRPYGASVLPSCLDSKGTLLFFAELLSSLRTHLASSIPSFAFSHHVGGGRRQEGEKGDEDHKQKGLKLIYRKKAKFDEC